MFKVYSIDLKNTKPKIKIVLSTYYLNVHHNVLNEYLGGFYPIYIFVSYLKITCINSMSTDCKKI